LIVTDLDSVDFFTDQSIVTNPYQYFDRVRSQSPVLREPHHGVVLVTGYEEAMAVFRDTDTFSNCNSVAGAFPGLPFEPQGDDISELIERFRGKFPMSEHMVTQDPPQHTFARALLSKLMTPRRLKENEDFMWALADRQLDEFLTNGRCEFLGEYAKPFSMLVIADLLGVPDEDRHEFRSVLATTGTVGGIDQTRLKHDPLEYLDHKFGTYIDDRRREPRDDVLTGLAEAKYPDGSTPDVIDVVHLATFLFAAGQETTTRLLSASLLMIAEDPDLQQLIRADRSLLPNFIEESLRMESPVKSDSRLARRSTTLYGVDIPAGTTVMVLPGAVNRDPRKFPDPHQFQIDRRNVREHIAFGRGIHSCPGAPLARVEGRISLERILDRMADIRISGTEHGPAGARRFGYEPTYILRGLTDLHLEFTATQ
jgi:cytochrome P450